MSAIDIITIIVVILFARLGIRLLFRYIKMKRQKDRDKK